MTAPRRRRVLIVEDEIDAAKVLTTRLEAAGFEVQVATTGAEGLSCALEQTPDLAILDVQLPDIDGYQVCQKLRQFCEPAVVPILMLTGMNQPADQVTGFSHGADAYLTKPYEADELLRTVHLLLENAASR